MALPDPSAPDLRAQADAALAAGVTAQARGDDMEAARLFQLAPQLHLEHAAQQLIRLIPSLPDPTLVKGAMETADRLAREGGEAIVADRFAARHAAALIQAGRTDLAVQPTAVALRSPEREVRTDALGLAGTLIDAAAQGQPPAPPLASLVNAFDVSALGTDERLALDARVGAYQRQRTEAILATPLVDQASVAFRARSPDYLQKMQEALNADPTTAVDIIDLAARAAERDGFNQDLDGIVRRAVATGDGLGRGTDVDAACVELGEMLAASRAPQSANRYLVRGLDSPDPEVQDRAVAAIETLVSRYEKGVRPGPNLAELADMVAAVPATPAAQRAAKEIAEARREVAGEQQAITTRARTAVVMQQRSADRDGPGQGISGPS